MPPLIISDNFFYFDYPIVVDLFKLFLYLSSLPVPSAANFFPENASLSVFIN